MASNSEPLPEGTVIMADNQFAGRGQQDNIWYAAPGLNLTVSIYLKPEFLPLNRQFMLNMAVCLGIKKTLQELVGPDILIKWPNDIYFRGKKLGGVLIENMVAGSSYKAAIVGIGLNVNQTEFDPAQVMSATSLAKILQQDVNLLTLLADICRHIETEYLRLKAGLADLTDEYLSNLYKFGKPARFRDEIGTFEGVIEGVTPAGQLLVSGGSKKTGYNFKEIEFLQD